MIEQAIFSILSNASGLTALVANRIYPFIPQNAVYPCVSYAVAEQGAAESFEGQGTFERIALEVDAWGDTFSDALDIADEVKTAIKNYSGSPAGIRIDKITVDGSVTVFEDQVEKYRKTLTANINRR